MFEKFKVLWIAYILDKNKYYLPVKIWPSLIEVVTKSDLISSNWSNGFAIHCSSDGVFFSPSFSFLLLTSSASYLRVFALSLCQVASNIFLWWGKFTSDEIAERWTCDVFYTSAQIWHNIRHCDCVYLLCVLAVYLMWRYVTMALQWPNVKNLRKSIQWMSIGGSNYIPCNLIDVNYSLALISLQWPKNDNLIVFCTVLKLLFVWTLNRCKVNKCWLLFCKQVVRLNCLHFRFGTL